ncbi:hypothetical protein BDF20DRAFT_915488 [Mycotypha africana]|uniref:uncharacterized protein n=1 Tax=Mycotypha africana TaxID=64632 RepID=UPI002301D905|nr:uncharacterized protein BDF20DRAFT_915488 [Mycotypha africana]KAI8971710.1 hypothetical protein BDF20DRAFT_915488 [Mycotypha africana]
MLVVEKHQHDLIDRNRYMKSHLIPVVPYHQQPVMMVRPTVTTSKLKYPHPKSKKTQQQKQQKQQQQPASPPPSPPSIFFAKTCSRMVQHTQNFNSRRATSCRSVLLPTSCSTTLKRQKFRRVSPTNSSNRKSCTTAATITSNQNNKKVQQEKCPLVALEEYLKKLKEKTAHSEEVIKNQNEEIANIRRLSMTSSQLKTRSMNEDAEIAVSNSTMHKKEDDKLELITKKIESLNLDHSDNALSTVDINDMVSRYTTQINELQCIIKANEENTAKQLEEYQRKISEKDDCLQREKELHKQLKEQYTVEMNRLKLEQEKQLREMEQHHENDLIQLRKEIEELKKLNHKSLDDAIEKALYEIEQEEHNHPPTTTLGQRNLRNVSSSSFKDNQKKIANQQWYSEKYIPSQAISWPAPQTSPNLKKQFHK